MADEANQLSLSDVIRVYRPLNTENWFPLDPKFNRFDKNKFVDGLRCDIEFVIRTCEGYAHWKIDNRPVRRNQIVTLERARSRAQKVRVSKILVDPNKLKARGHSIARELLSVSDAPKLELRPLPYMIPNETVQLVPERLRGVSQPEPMENEPEVVIQPVFATVPVPFIKQEPIDPDEDQDLQSISEISSVPPMRISDSIAPEVVRRSTRISTLIPPSEKYKVDLPRRRRRRK